MNAWELFCSKIKGVESISSDGVITFKTDTITEQEVKDLSHLRMSAITGQIFDDRETLMD